MNHTHRLSYTGKTITAVYRKNNTPEDYCVHSEGEEAFCVTCSSYFIVHNDRRLAERATELEGIA